ncbi:hypothetical protein G7Y41_06995 [Schaalia sp. ZJ405]|uniref:hypothetical protein n=1 Tax=Schaalia sp. ZJ405 TaxID=2709403 RepID=UPI0013E9DCD1|nr:hypothetical protein [Schaalia sp. ZJ405]QPK80801.1 hypothetical protein G7Y41_06995 [Schaalia sp. ZJ405]
MTITPANAGDMVAYLVNAGCLNARPDQGTVWADFINDDCPNATPTDMLPAARLAIRKWKAANRGYQVDVTYAVEAIREVRANRHDSSASQNVPTPDGLADDPQAWLKWRREVARLMGDGVPKGKANQLALEHVGYTPPPELPTTKGTIPQLFRRKP